ncbi:LysR family transcriptional regulator [Paenibacillus kribbensis]|uniref:LysR family transcriptional regulator n=1 Tax=Paenibacillus kribbensis TaxID=172713 RepID=UPI0015C08AF3|nr:LysR family transcriptional regulator [Paenibacillus kribbensis]
MEIRNVTTFMKVAELRNFSHAAIQLGYSQSTVTVQIKQLEEELGTQLFERFGKHVQLTEHGKQFIGYATDILKTVQAAKTMVSLDENPTGTLQIGVIESLSSSVLPSILMEFQKLCPLVETRIKTGLNTDMYDMVQRNEIDMIYFLDQKIYRPEWVKIIERPEPIVFVASSEHPLTQEKNVRVETILKESLVLTEKGYSYRYDLEQILAAQGYELHPVLEIGNTDIILKFLLNNVGISFLPFFVVRELVDAGKLSIINTDCVSIQMWSQLAYHKNKWITPQMQRFMDTMKKHASK